MIGVIIAWLWRPWPTRHSRCGLVPASSSNMAVAPLLPTRHSRCGMASAFSFVVALLPLSDSIHSLWLGLPICFVWLWRHRPTRHSRCGLAPAYSIVVALPLVDSTQSSRLGACPRDWRSVFVILILDILQTFWRELAIELVQLLLFFNLLRSTWIQRSISELFVWPTCLLWPWYLWPTRRSRCGLVPALLFRVALVPFGRLDIVVATWCLPC
jgi:hypothetical protein